MIIIHSQCWTYIDLINFYTATYSYIQLGPEISSIGILTTHLIITPSLFCVPSSPCEPSCLMLNPPWLLRVRSHHSLSVSCHLPTIATLYGIFFILGRESLPSFCKCYCLPINLQAEGIWVIKVKSYFFLKA